MDEVRYARDHLLPLADDDEPYAGTVVFAIVTNALLGERRIGMLSVWKCLVGGVRGILAAL